MRCWKRRAISRRSLHAWSGRYTSLRANICRCLLQRLRSPLHGLPSPALCFLNPAQETVKDGNIFRGWDGYLGKQASSGAIRRINRFREADRMFSASSVTSGQASTFNNTGAAATNKVWAHALVTLNHIEPSHVMARDVVHIVRGAFLRVLVVVLSSLLLVSDCSQMFICAYFPGGRKQQLWYECEGEEQARRRWRAQARSR